MPHPVQFEPSWTRVPDKEPVQYSRPLQGPELMHDCADRLNNGLAEVVMGLTFKTTLSDEELESRTREAIGRMRFIIPIIACAIQPDPSNPFSASFVYTTVRDQADLRAWISATLSVRRGHVDSGAFVAEMNARTLPYVHPDGHEQPSHFYLLVGDSPRVDNGSEVVHGLFMHGPHTLMDAFPTLRCLDALVSWIADPPAESIDQLPWGEEWHGLPVPPIAATGGIRDDWDTEGVKLMQEMNEMLMHPVPTHSLVPTRVKLAVPGRMTRIHARFDSEISARIVRSTKALGFTPSALLDAAVCLATFAKNPVQPEDAATAHFTLDPTVIAQDRYLVPPHNGLSHFIAGLCLVCLRIPYASIPHSAPRNEQLIAVMTERKTQLSHYLQNANLPHVMPAQLAYNPPRMAKDISNPYVSTTSNMGNISSLVNDKERTTSSGMKEKVVQLDDMVLGHRLPWGRIVFHCWSFKGEMRLQVQASDIWDEEVIRSYFADVQSIMLSILDSPPGNMEPTPQRLNGATVTACPEDGKTVSFPGEHFTRTLHHEPYPAIALHPTDLAGRVVFISGATSCTGRAAALAFTRAGAAGFILTAREQSLSLLDNLEDAMNHAALENGCAKPKALKVMMDVLDDASILSAVSQARSSFGSVDILLNLAGYIDECVPLSISNLESWWKAIETNVRGTCAVTQAVLPLLKDGRSEAKWIVNYSSLIAVISDPQCSGYNISKLALLRLTEILSVELSSSPEFSGINVVACHPGTVRSRIALSSLPPEYHDMMIDTPELSAESVAWIVKERRDWLNGRFISCTWDLPELVERREEVEKDDLLKMKFSF